MLEARQNKRYRKMLELLVAERKARGITQIELGERLGVRQTVISKIELGERRIDVIEFLEIADALGISPNSFIEKL